jgi:hypothetical protein
LAFPDRFWRSWTRRCGSWSRRAISETGVPGEHVQFQLLPSVDPVTFVVNLAASIAVGIDDGLQEAGLGRALGTEDVFRPFGVGGPTYPTPPTADVQTEPLDAEPAAAAAALAPASPAGGSEAQAPETVAVTDAAATVTSQQDEDVTGKDPAPAAEPAGTDTDASIPEATKPDRPKVRGPIEFDTPKARPFGDQPFKRLSNVLTGQKPQAETAAQEATEAGAEPSADSESDAAA